MPPYIYRPSSSSISFQFNNNKISKVLVSNYHCEIHILILRGKNVKYLNLYYASYAYSNSLIERSCILLYTYICPSQENNKFNMNNNNFVKLSLIVLLKKYEYILFSATFSKNITNQVQLFCYKYFKWILFSWKNLQISILKWENEKDNR